MTPRLPKIPRAGQALLANTNISFATQTGISVLLMSLEDRVGEQGE
jgi:hypothetical protein